MEARSRRRISSLSVTYQEELHRPRPYELAAHSNNPFPPRPVPSALLVQGDQSLEHLLLCNVPGAELTGHSPQDGSFYSSISVSKPQPAPNLLLRAPAPVPSSSSRQCDCLPPPPYPCSHHWSCSAPAALHGLEEALRMRLNQEMESFRASLHQLLCAQFTQHRLQSLRHCLLPCQPLAGDNVSEDPALVPCSQSLQSSPECCTEQCTETEHGYYETDPCGYHEECSPDGSSSYSNDASSGTVDSGVAEGEVPCEHSEEETEINACLIQLLTSASLLTSALQREEYAVT